MAVHDMTTTAAGAATQTASSGGWRSGVRSRFYRLTHLPANGDVFQIFDVAKGETVVAIAMKVVTGTDGTTPTISIGLTGGTTDGYLTAQAVTVAAEDTTYIGTGVYFGTTESTAVQGAFTSADTIDALFSVTGTPTATMTIDFEMITISTTLA